jgi:hypothetical protein
MNLFAMLTTIVNRELVYYIDNMNKKYHSEERRNLQKFFRDRPAISKAAIAEEIGISRQYLDYILNGDRRLTPATKEKMRPVLMKYGNLYPITVTDFSGFVQCPKCKTRMSRNFLSL